MKKTVIFHGTLGSPEGNWFPWLKNDLMNKGEDVLTPALPTPENQSLETWIKAFKDQIPEPQHIDVLIGHSLGATLALRILEKKLITPQTTLLVSTVIDKINNEEYDRLNHSFIDTPFQWESIQESCSNIKILHGDNDPYVPLEQPQEVAQHLNITLHKIKNGGHLNAESEYTKFPELLEFL